MEVPGTLQRSSPWRSAGASGGHKGRLCPKTMTRREEEDMRTASVFPKKEINTHVWRRDEWAEQRGVDEARAAWRRAEASLPRRNGLHAKSRTL